MKPSVNRLTSINGPGLDSYFAFDDRNFVTQITHNHGNLATITQFNYVMDEIGNRTQMTTPQGAHDYQYDDNNQLTQATNPETPAAPQAGRAPASFNTETFSYDSIANRTQDQGGSYTYDSKSQRLTEDYRNFYFYDNNGNLISKQEKGLNGPTTNYIYSSENQLIRRQVFDPTYSATNPIRETVYAYDALGRRIRRRVVDHTAESNILKTYDRRYVYDGQEVVAEFNEANQLLVYHTHSGLRTDDVLVSRVTDQGVADGVATEATNYLYLKDAQGTVTDIINQREFTHIAHYVYSAFGTLLGIQDANGADITANPPERLSYTFTGREFDSDSGLYYYRARYYDSSIGRFLQEDPDPGNPSLPASIVNKYIYAANNPILLEDPSGMIFWNSTIGKITVGLVMGAAIAFSAGAAAPAFVSMLGGASALGSVGVAAVGIATSAIFGGLAGGALSALYGGSFVDGFVTGAISGAVIGAASVAGGIVGGLGSSGLGSAALGLAAGAGVGSAGFALTGIGPWWQGAIAGGIAGGLAGYRPSSSTNMSTARNVGYPCNTTFPGWVAKEGGWPGLKMDEVRAEYSADFAFTWSLFPTTSALFCAIAYYQSVDRIKIDTQIKESMIAMNSGNVSTTSE